MWLVWGVAASLPPLLGRNPLPLAAILFVALGVWASQRGQADADRWTGLLRLAAFALALGVVFNLLTAHAGDLVIGRLPEWLPIVGGVLTLNALIYGLLAGLATFSLITIALTVGMALDWGALLRLLPERMTSLAVVGAIAWGLAPQTMLAFREIREAQAARGHRLRSPRDALPIAVPLLAGGLERSFTLAEALEARAFGAPPGVRDGGGTRWVWLAIPGLAVGIVGGYLLAVGSTVAAVVCLATAAGVCWLSLRRAGRGALPRRTRYRSPAWGPADTIVVVAAAAAMLAMAATLALDPAAFAYEPYPSLTAPAVNLPLLAAIALLLAPAFAAP
ncbi:MAG TPA: energy-coupling factor transporter transmembrane component T [Thermomicrobiales bacterium]|nr:energy-coupling factor transporter transmembrane component T [Thermomicrobiales bacterium]